MTKANSANRNVYFTLNKRSNEVIYIWMMEGTTIFVIEFLILVFCFLLMRHTAKGRITYSIMCAAIVSINLIHLYFMRAYYNRFPEKSGVKNADVSYLIIYCLQLL